MQGKAAASSVEKTTIKVPFAFAIGNQLMPAGQYQIEMLTESKPGQDNVEVLAFRGKDTRAYASFVAFLEEGAARSPRLTFRHDGEGTTLTEVQVHGKSFRLAPSRYASDSVSGLYQTISGDESIVWQMGR